ncbi:HlyD family secretion protein [Caulobacter sp. 17J80-11]|uniref:HlyD family secretion protein n=1 Tax=Caulobacter sp. 17J80-11 TaxID=2763502 RepID=UPI0016537CA8|nr:HlyD family secretion protein [Caulobacter sp. 17J80-11]MBC6982821.1 HlyD family secretion protein [Caulobacter sp. 17J80-11]
MPKLPFDKKRAPQIVAGVAAVAVIVGGVVWWQGKARWEGTDNAYVQADTVAVSPQVTGYVAEVLVRDNQQVTPGQVLVKLDPAEAQAQLAQAEANLAALEAAVRNVDDRAALERSLIAERQAGVASAQATARLAKTDLDRYGRLADQGWVAPQRLQSASAQADQAGAAVAQAHAGLEAQRREANALGSTRAQTLAQVEQARATVAQARINLDRTIIRAPVGGVVGARAVRPGQYVRPGGQLMAVVPLGRAYIVANFKETQVGRMRVGQEVEVTADAFKGQKFKGRVESFSPATGSEFALIPVENATGNFTKIVQRVPVKIAVEPTGPLAAALRPGLSVKVRVDLKSSGGQSFAEAGVANTAYAEAGR